MSLKRAIKQRFFSIKKKINFPTITTAINLLTNKRFLVDINSELPLGCGFGLSGACTLATMLSINKLLKLNKSSENLAMIAHISEVQNYTGLGDVAGQFNGGFLMKTKIGNPLEVERLNIQDKYVYYRVFGPLSTKGVLNDKRLVEKINSAGDIAIKKVKKLKAPTLSAIIKISKEFAMNSGLLRERIVVEQIRKIEKLGGNASMIMLGNAVYSDIPFYGCERAEISKRSACLVKKQQFL